MFNEMVLASSLLEMLGHCWDRYENHLIESTWLCIVEMYTAVSTRRLSSLATFEINYKY